MTLRYDKKEKILYAQDLGEKSRLSLNNQVINQDIFFAPLFLFAQCHENLAATPDEHGRIRSSENLLVKLGIHEIPVVDHTFNNFVKILAKSSRFDVTKPIFKIGLSHDVDRPARWAFNTRFKYSVL